MNLKIIQESGYLKTPDTDLCSWLLMNDPDCLQDIEFPEGNNQGFFVFKADHVFPNNATIQKLIAAFECGLATGEVTRYCSCRKYIMRLLYVAMDRRKSCNIK